MPKRSWSVKDIEEAFVVVDVFEDEEDVVDSVDIDAEEENFNVGESSMSGRISVGVCLDLIPRRSLNRESLELLEAFELDRLVLACNDRSG